MQELDKQVYALGSVKYAVIGISKEIGLTSEETEAFFNAVVNGPENAEILSIVAKKAGVFTEQQKLGVLSTIHDGWVMDNCSEKTFNKKVDRKQLRQYAPLELIGWNEVKSDLLFLTPILASIGIKVEEMSLATAYHENVANYMEENQLNKEDDITSLLQQGKKYYPALPDHLEEKLLPRCAEISSQIIQNWENKDNETYKIWCSRNKKKK